MSEIPVHKSILIASGVSKKYWLGKTEVQALQKVDLEVAAGEFLAIAGSSGSGKTTLLNLIGGIDSPSEGHVIVDGIALHKLIPDELARFRSLKIGFVFQTFNLIPTLSALENVEYPLVLLYVDAKKRRRLAEEALEHVGLKDKMRNKPAQLSGGQRQRVAIARAMVKRPKLVLADEPTANLDKATATEILDLMQKINRERGTTFIFSTHDPMILQRASRIFPVGQDSHAVSFSSDVRKVA